MAATRPRLLATPRHLLVRVLPAQATRSPHRPLVRRPAPLTLLRRRRTRLLRQLTAGTRSRQRLHLTRQLRHLTHQLHRLTLPRRQITVRHRRLHTLPVVRRHRSTPRRLPTTARLRRRPLLTLLPRQIIRRLLPSTVVQEPVVHHPRPQATHQPHPCTARVATAIRPLHRRTALPRRSTRLTLRRMTLARVHEESFLQATKGTNKKNRLQFS
jgi:hypothetical protein